MLNVNVSPSASTNRRYAQAAERLGAVEVIRTCYELDAARLPASVRKRLSREGLRAQRIGSTTYRSSTWALIPV
jgi:DNA polymerase III delta subunit